MLRKPERDGAVQTPRMTDIVLGKLKQEGVFDTKFSGSLGYKEKLVVTRPLIQEQLGTIYVEGLLKVKPTEKHYG